LSAPLIARKQSAKSVELRATTSLAGLLAKQGCRAEARVMLAEIYGWFTVSPASRVGIAEVARPSGTNELPQSPQTGFSRHHSWGRSSQSCAPQSPQNFFPDGLSGPHFAQRVRENPSQDHYLRKR
jgi:hypothetical protein